MAERPRVFDRLMTWAVVAVPTAVAVSRATGGVQWRGDMPAVRDLGLASLGFGGGVSTAVTQICSLLPLGNHAFRSAVGVAVACGIAALFMQRVAKRLLSTTPIGPRLSSLLATVAAAMAAVSPTWQREATVGGGATVAAAIMWGALDQTLEHTRPEARSLTPEATRRWLVIAALSGLALAESFPAGAALAVAIPTTILAADKRPSWRSWPAMILVLVAAVAFGSAPTLLRPLAPHSLADLTQALSASSLDALQEPSRRDAALLSWAAEVGVLSLGLSALGLVLGVWREPRRAATTPLVVLVVIDLVYPMQAAGAAVAPLAPLRLCALGALAIASSLGVAEAVAFLRRLEVPMAKTAAVLAVVFHVTLVALTCEEAAFAADRSEHVVAEEWTDVALEQLPRDSAVLVHSSALTWRLWAAQTLRGQRPDVLVIPAPLLRRGEVMRHLVPSEPAVSQLLQDFALQGRASEYGLSVLADARPLRVELDPRWNQEVVEHLGVEGAWLVFAPERLGRSDRKAAMRGHVLGLDSRIGEQVRAPLVPDPSSAAVVARTLKEHASVLSLVGMSPDTSPLIDGVERLAPDDPFVSGARLRLAHAERTRRGRRSLELRDLLRFDALEHVRRMP